MIYIFWPTCRPKMMLETFDFWMSRCVKPENVHIRIGVDTREDLVEVDHFDDVVFCEHCRKGVVDPLNKMLEDFEVNDNDIMIVASDDFYPPPSWDFYLENEAMENFNGVLKVNDGQMADIITIPIMRYSAFVKMGRIIYHPAYRHMFCDKELHDTAQELGICRSVERSAPLWEHRHPVFGTRDPDIHDNFNNEMYQEGKEIYAKRRYLTLTERMEK